uniref:Uncharacterized protein n=1 Tax=Nothobranchius kuhntae TaxID=321403 RepID=A0A1A8JHS5_NOTKU
MSDQLMSKGQSVLKPRGRNNTTLLSEPPNVSGSVGPVFHLNPPEDLDSQLPHQVYPSSSKQNRVYEKPAHTGPVYPPVLSKPQKKKDCKVQWKPDPFPDGSTCSRPVASPLVDPCSPSHLQIQSPMNHVKLLDFGNLTSSLSGMISCGSDYPF